jgi:5,6-dimethylbenzimidazole synthase
MNPHAYSDAEVSGVYRAIRERRDVRHFKPGPLEPGQLERFLGAAHHGPSVGYMQPWRFVRITDAALRASIHQHVNEERIKTAEALDQRADDFMKLKVEGILDCAEVLVVGLIDKRDQYIFGRRTMPEMDLASAACALQNFWLAARAEGIGAGWVSMFDPQRLRGIVGMPEGSQPIAVLCVGQVHEFYTTPMLELEKWDQRRPLTEILFENRWDNTAASST